MTTRNRLAALLALAILPGLSPSPRAQQADEKTALGATVPFEMLPSNHMVVEAKLNGKGPYRLVFDVGSPITLLSGKAAEASGAIKKGAPKSFLFGMRGEGRVDTLEVGDLKAKDLPVVVMDHPALKALGEMLGKPLDGIIGFTFFARYRTAIDYKAREMTFTPVKGEVRNLIRDLTPEKLFGPKVARTRVLAPRALWGLTLGEARGDGVAIKSVAERSPADEAGLRAGDLLTTLDGRWTTSVADTFAAVADVPAGQSVAVTVRRDGQDVTLAVTPKDGL